MSFDITQFFDKMQYSDVTLTFSGRRIKCHKMILCSKSKYFNDMFGPDSQFMESQQSEIPLKDDDDPDAVEAMLADLYDLNYSKKFQSRANDPRFHLNVIITAQKYNMPELEKRALEVLQRTIPLATDNITIIRELIDKHKGYTDQNKEVDKLISKTEEENLSKLMETPEYRDKFAKDNDLQQLVVRRLAFAESLVQTDLVRCITCLETFSSKSEGRVTCLTCHKILQDKGAMKDGAEMLTHWKRKGDP